MDREQVIKNMRAAIELNKHVREQTNNALSQGLGLLEKQDGEYERGFEDCMNAVKKIMRLIPCGEKYLSYDDLETIFGTYSWQDIIRDNTAHEFISKIEAYEKKKEEEAVKPKLGDVVEVVHRNRIGQETRVKGIYLQETDETHNVIVDGGTVYIFEKEYVVSVDKTGDFLDIPGTLRFIK